ncbi:MAG TPA: hypothetical protein PJ990_16140 [Saprospiraceae bacterium]|nr:hypothetical protein [Saprospiraceae bacterium]
MKIILFIAVLIVTNNVVFSQDYMDKIALKSCECINTISDTLEGERYKSELGICMINAAIPYKKQLKKDYKIDINNIDKHAEELGGIIGARMLSVCPNSLLKIENIVSKKKESEITENIIEGQVTAISDDKFVEFSIKDKLGKISKYYWFTYIESSVELSVDYKILMDKFVQIVFVSKEFFDARIDEYRPFNIIQKLEIINK